MSKNSLNIHLKQHFSQFNYSEFEFLKTECYDKIKRKFKCNLCYHEIQSFSHMVRHVTGWHKKEIDLIKNISTKLKCEYPCQECGLKFITKHSKFVHRLLHHYYETEGKCSLCDLKFVNTKGGLMHRRRIHKHELHAFNIHFSDEDKTHVCQSPVIPRV